MPPSLPLSSLKPVPFWLWLSDPDPAQLRTQLGQVRDQGFGGVYLQPFPRGFRDQDFHSQMGPAFATEEYFRRVADLAAIVFDCGLHLWLYDEGGWPAGTAAVEIVRLYPDLAGRVLRCVPGPPPPDTPTYAAEEHCHYRIELRPGRTDLFHPQTVQHFLELVHEGYRRRLKSEFGKRIPGIFTDEPSVQGRVGSSAIPWGHDMERMFRRRKGYALSTRLACLFDPAVTGGAAHRFTDEQIRQTRRDFADHWGNRLRDSYIRPLFQWCEQNNLALCGHLNGDDNLQEHARGGSGQPLRMLRHFHVPGVDAVSGQLRPGGANTDYPRMAASAAAFSGRRDALADSFGGYGWGLCPAEMAWISAYLIVRGITFHCPMAIHSDTAGPHLYATMSELGPGNPLFPFMHLWAGMVTRAAESLRSLPRDLRVGVFYPIGEIWAGEEVAAAFELACRELSTGLIDFNWWDEDALNECRIERNWLRLGLATCRILIFPHPARLAEWTLERLREFLTAGGTIFCLNGRPAGLPDSERIFEIEGDLSARVWRRLEPTFQWETSGTEITGARHGPPTAPEYVLFNEGDTHGTVRVSHGTAEPPAYTVFDPESGSQTAPLVELRGGRRFLRVDLPGHGLRILRRGAPRGKVISVADHAEGTEIFRVSEDWRVYQQARCQITPEGVQRRVARERLAAVTLGDWSQQGLPHFSGTLSYEADFILPERRVPQSVLVLDLGEVRHAVHLWLNGRDLGRRAWPPYRFDVSGIMRLGRNRLRVEVTNTLANQASSTEAVASAKASGWWNQYRDRAEPLIQTAMRSGLIGPVTVREIEPLARPRR